VLFLLLRVARSPFGHVLVAIRENQLRATFQGYPGRALQARPRS
jgi:ABC-type branched-subunit amino acid transport system permease subunit